ncbi:hypothetical protein PPACK8108_LOCUS655, partial [Phakopsora pachyrhizi]
LGSCTVRAGYSGSTTPYLETESAVSKYRDCKTNRTIMLAGSDCYVDTMSRSNVRPLHEDGIVCNYDSI